MKAVILFAFLIWSTNTFAQALTYNISEARPISTKTVEKGDQITLFCGYREVDKKYKPAYFVNGKFLSDALITALNPEAIESFEIVKEAVKIDSVTYYSQIHIRTKNKNYWKTNSFNKN